MFTVFHSSHIFSMCGCLCVCMHICWNTTNNPHLFVLQCNGLHKSHHILLRDSPLGPSLPLPLWSSLVLLPQPHLTSSHVSAVFPPSLIFFPPSHFSHFSVPPPIQGLRRGLLDRTSPFSKPYCLFARGLSPSLSIITLAKPDVGFDAVRFWLCRVVIGLWS